MVRVEDVKLRACPFCKGEVELWKYQEVIKCRFICKKCKVEVEFPRGFDAKDCIKKWNVPDTTTKGITAKPIEEQLSDTICMDPGPNQFKTIYYKPTCPHGYDDCIYDPAYIKATYPAWYEKLFGKAEPEAVACSTGPEGYCRNGERYDDEDK